jgi:hypothetical protein
VALPEILQIGQQVFLARHAVHLVDRRNHRHAGRRDGLEGRGVLVRPTQCLHDEQRQVGIADRGAGRAIQIAVECVGPALMDPRGIDKEDLPLGTRLDAEDGMAGGLGLVRGDRDLLAHQAVQQGRFADIGPSDDGHGPAATDEGFRHS